MGGAGTRRCIRCGTRCERGRRISNSFPPGRPRDEDIEVVAGPAPVGEREHEVAVEATGLAEVDVLDAGRVSESGASQPVGELAGVAFGELAVDDEPEAFLEAEGRDLG